jgi:hypothetical protein
MNENENVNAEIWAGREGDKGGYQKAESRWLEQD